ncbi:N-hydroxyarylamine O-acetyltransferase [Breoghania corrubedonensis]|uniref:N-hydroxyarylamine O-acetyltransferase n=1 Tax=Breoghania corrubedonensis TaxID=665038 RepID=A0A2T5V4W6_9HYPH|nr:arylamine N-acetyltransferase [Breoghania corrubedonensis]PTW58798.1 N-hydroxyarylamine O-acetyltransferase [Breoghania corrubedonensis]
MTFDLDAYLARIRIDAPSATSRGLARLQEAHLSAIPFESLDPLMGRVPALEPEALQRKLVAGRRGGYCFEQNGLMALALDALGFQFERVLARVRNGGERGGVRSHLAHVVHVEGRDWLVDVGFGGGGARRPVPLERYRLDYQSDEVYRIATDPATGETVLQRLAEDGWYSLYGFERGDIPPIDIEAANHLCATWDKAPFSGNLMLHRLTPWGRIGVFNAKVTEVRDGVKSVRELRDAGNLDRLLRSDFGLALADEEIDAIAGKLRLPMEEDARSVA